jgi:prevent-host-death family protein
MKTVSAREANQGFSKLLGEVEAGEEIVITKRGQPVARLQPYRVPEMTPERKAAIKRMVEGMRKGIPLGGPPYPTRDELHER